MIHLVRPVSEATRRAQRLLARTGRGPLGHAWRIGYLLVARVAGRYLAGGTSGASVYLRGSVGTSDLVPFVSDVDLVVLLGNGRASRAGVHLRWERLRRRLPLFARLVDRPRVHPVEELGLLLGCSAYTVGLDDDGGVAPAGDRFSLLDRNRLLERPGLYDTTRAWRLLAGHERRPPEPPRDPQQERVAAWLELVYHWKRALEAIADPTPPHTAALCVKLVSEPARVALWLAHGERPRSRADVLARAEELLPDEVLAIRRIAVLDAGIQRLPSPPLGPALHLLARLSAAVADELGHQLAGAPTTRVRLVGGCEGEDVPLCDWRAVVRTGHPGELFRVGAGHPGDFDALRAAIAEDDCGRYTALTDGSLLVFASRRRDRVAMRAVSCPATDPVSAALLAGRGEAAFPDVDGWSAGHWAQRAVGEHGRRLATGEMDLSGLASAARAALFHESLAEDDPELPVTHDAALRRLAARHPGARAVAERAAEALRLGALPERAVLDALRRQVGLLPAFAKRSPSGLPAGSGGAAGGNPGERRDPSVDGATPCDHLELPLARNREPRP